MCSSMYRLTLKSLARHPSAGAPQEERAALRRLSRSLFLILAAATLSVGFSAGSAAAACKPLSYCSRGGPCVPTSVIRSEARKAFGVSRGSPWTIARIRLVGQAPTASCLWYEVWVKGPNGAAKTGYWDINGRRVR